MSGSSTYDLSTLYSALGVRAKDAVARIPTGTLLPVIVLGNIETFAPAVVEARGLAQFPDTICPGGQWASYFLFATSAGGIIIEDVTHGNVAFTAGFYALNLAPTKPFTGLGVTSQRMLSMGGRPIFARIEFLQAVNPAPDGSLLGGSRCFGLDPEAAEGIWVPPGWYFWLVFQNTSGGGLNYNLGFRWRELQEPQGAP